ncbi:MAG: MqnA/MqnD/SBP family protein [Candidatus Kapabacteria bacterium]|jgi:hypothetical protein|nr:MqnA/MqnD/SBP family protein [Candidatus Kapabacteria bacterium]
MKQRIYVPNNFQYPDIICNIENVCKERNFELIRIDEKTCIEHTLLNRASLTLMSPYGYGLGVKNADFRIIPTHTAGIVGYSAKASLYFKSGLSTIDKIACPNPDDFMMKIGKILLSERYDIHAEFEKAKGTAAELLESNAVVMDYGNDRSLSSMDISEDWFETFEIPLLLGVWVARNEEEPKEVEELTRLFTSEILPDESAIFNSDDDTPEERQGRILTRWTDETKSALSQTLELLYYHRLLPEIPAIKIYGID